MAKNRLLRRRLAAPKWVHESRNHQRHFEMKSGKKTPSERGFGRIESEKEKEEKSNYRELK